MNGLNGFTSTHQKRWSILNRKVNMSSEKGSFPKESSSSNHRIFPYFTGLSPLFRWAGIFSRSPPQGLRSRWWLGSRIRYGRWGDPANRHSETGLGGPVMKGGGALQGWKFRSSPNKMMILMPNLMRCTPPRFNIAPEKWWLEDEFPFGIAYFYGLC